MGGFARVAVPIAVGIAAPYAATALAPAIVGASGVSAGQAALLSGVQGVLSGLSAHQQARQQNAAYRRQREVQLQEQARLKQEFDQAEEERQRDERIKLAQLRTQFSAQGRSPTEGSAAAVIANFARESDEIGAQHFENYRSATANLFAQAPQTSNTGAQFARNLLGAASSGVSLMEQ